MPAPRRTAKSLLAALQPERCQGLGCSNFIAVASPTSTAYSDTNLLANTSYSYQVRAFDTAATPGAYSNQATTSTPTPAAPTAPAGLTATGVNATQINLTWTASTSSVGLANYILQRCQGAGCATFTTIASPPASSTSYSDPGLTTGTSWGCAPDQANAGRPNWRSSWRSSCRALRTGPITRG